ncbi:hypothetical protein F5883DRAFT_535429 [Diaporthe sp. PMI_573]|jgi:hypothetical protein|nr:hypothetical protein F5883DRAFT_535429 [Diaporthaceae sp. PMI_573]
MAAILGVIISCYAVAPSLGVTSTQGHVGDKAAEACTNLGAQPSLLTFRRREGAGLRVRACVRACIFTNERNNFSGFQGRAVAMGLRHNVYIQRP